MITGYTTGVFDLFHIGHLNVLRTARSLCDRLIVGVSTDELMFQYKGRYPIIPFKERIEIIRSLSCVDAVVMREVRDKYEEWKRLKFDVVFVGDDWYGSKEWKEWEAKLREINVYVIYLPYTPGRSSTKIIERIRA